MRRAKQHMIYASTKREIHKRKTMGTHQIANKPDLSYTTNTHGYKSNTQRIDIKYISEKHKYTSNPHTHKAQ